MKRDEERRREFTVKISTVLLCICVQKIKQIKINKHFISFDLIILIDSTRDY